MSKKDPEDPGPEESIQNYSSKNKTSENKLRRRLNDFVIGIKNCGIFSNRIYRDVFGHPKNLLDFKRQITKCGPLSIF